MPDGAQHEIELLDHMYRQPDGARLVHDRPFDPLTNPPGCVGRKPEAPLRIEFLKRVNEAEVTFFDQIQQGNATIQVVLGDVDDQTQVAFDHGLARRKITGTHGARCRGFFRRRQQGLGANLVQIQLGNVVENLGFGTDCFTSGRRLAFGRFEFSLLRRFRFKQRVVFIGL